MKIYLDIDGVLSDFEKRYVEKFGEFPKDFEKRKTHFWDNWKKFVDDKDFETLPMHKDADKLLAAVKKFHDAGVPVEILSSSGGGYSHEIVAAQKRKWLDANGIHYKANIVPGGGHKAKYAAPWNILVDDTQHVIDRYREAGGTTIHYTDVDKAIKELSTLHLEWHGGQ